MTAIAGPCSPVRRKVRTVTVGADVVLQRASYGLELVDALTGGPLVGRSTVVVTSTQATPYLVNASRWVFSTLLPTPPPLVIPPATFVITADFYVGQTVTTGPTGNVLPDGTMLVLPNPTAGGPGYLATIPMMPRTGYPFSPTLTRVVGLVQYGSAPVPNAAVTLTPVPQPATPTAVTVTTTDDGQYTYWFLPRFLPQLEGKPPVLETPPIANQLTGSVSATVGGTLRTGSLALLNLVLNGVTNAPPILLS